MKKRKNGGFTLLEILAVISIVIVLLGLVIGLASVVTQKASEAKAHEDLEKIRQIVDDYKFEHGGNPTNLTAAIENAILQRHLEKPVTTLTKTERDDLRELHHDELLLKYDPWGSSYTSNNEYDEDQMPKNNKALQYVFGSRGRDSRPGFRGKNDDNIGSTDDLLELGFGDDITNIR